MLENLTALNAVPIAKDDDTVIDPPLKALVVTAAGTVVYKNEHDTTITLILTTAPFIMPGRVRQILDTGTDIADSALIGLR
jgi:hypothetical protein